MHISKLPAELVAKICVLLLRPDLKNVRLLCRAWNDAAQPPLFENILLRVNVHSFEKLQDISRHDTFSKYVKNIIFDGRVLGPYLARKGFETWVRYGAGGNLDLTGDDRDKFVSKFSKQQLETYYFNYCRYLFAQEYILSRDNGKEMLLDILQRLPRLSAINYFSVAKTYGDEIPGKIPSLQSLSSVAQEILAEGQGNWGWNGERHLDSDGNFFNLLQAACLPNHAQQLKDVRASHLQLYCWGAAAKLLSDCYPALPALNHLSLEFHDANHTTEDLVQLSQMITHTCWGGTSSLKFLHIAFNTDTRIQEDKFIELSQVIVDKTHWEQLRTLSLRLVNSTEGFLRSLLQRHAKSLRSLELSTMNLHSSIIHDQYGRGSWISLIHFMNQELSLEHVRFSGLLTNYFNEVWATDDPGIYNDDCLRYRIQRFITHSGPSPFTPKKVRGGKGSDKYSRIPWAFEQDESWYVDEIWDPRTWSQE